MIPEKYKNYMYNENDFFNEGFVVTDPEKDELVRKLACLITDDISIHSPKQVTTDLPDYCLHWMNDLELTGKLVPVNLSCEAGGAAMTSSAPRRPSSTP